MSSANSPSRDAVLVEIQERLGPNPTVGTFLSIVKELSPAQTEALLSNPVKSLVVIQDQQAAVKVEVAKALSSNENDEHLKTAADAAGAAVAKLQEMFDSLLHKLGPIDVKHKQNFVPKARALHEQFTHLVQSSKVMATKITDYGRQFDVEIMRFCANPERPLQDRQEKITQFIKEIETFSGDALGTKSTFDEFESAFAAFESSFSSWASGKEGPMNKDLDQATKKLHELQHRIEELSKEIKDATRHVRYATFIPFIGSIAGRLSSEYHQLPELLADIEGASQETKETSNRIDSLKGQAGDIRATRSDIQDTGKVALARWRKNISETYQLWQHVLEDAIHIQDWVKNGAKYAEMPDYMIMCLDNKVGIYQGMAKYLEQYVQRV